MSEGGATAAGLSHKDLFSANIVDNYDIDATGGGLWTSTTVYKVVTASGYANFLYGGMCSRDANQAATVSVFNAADKEVLRLGTIAAAATVFSYPDSGAGSIMLPVKIPAGYYLKILLAGAQGAAAWASAYMLSVRV